MANLTLTIQFNILGNLRFLSHIETYKLFQRMLIRCGIDLAFSEGFNPRPKMSLILPRPVGVCSDDEILTAELKSCCLGYTEIVEKLSSDTIDGCIIKSVEINEKKTAFAADKAVYRFKLKQDFIGSVAEKIRYLNELKSQEKPFIIERTTEKVRKKIINMLDFIDEMQIKDNVADITVNIFNDGSVRIDEMLNMLDIKNSNLCEPILRTAVTWRKK